MKIINICNDFSETPGARYRVEGPFSGEEFRETLLIPTYIQAINEGEKITIELDGGYGYPTSFLEEAFGGIARIYDASKILDTLSFISYDEPSLVEEIISYIKNAKKE